MTDEEIDAEQQEIEARWNAICGIELFHDGIGLVADVDAPSRIRPCPKCVGH